MLPQIKCKFVLAFIMLVSILAHGQSATFQDIKLKPNARYYDAAENTFDYPIVVTKNKHTDSLLNTQVKADVFAEDTKSIYKVLEENINEYGLINLSYETTFNKDGILSFSVSAEGCGAHCSTNTTYFNFNIQTGKKITIEDMLLPDKTDSFKAIVLRDKMDLLNKYIKQEKERLSEPDIDSSIVNWALEQVNDNCINTVSIDAFSLLKSGIEINDACEFPYAIRSEEPSYQLLYPYKFMTTFLKPKYRSILLQNTK